MKEEYGCIIVYAHQFIFSEAGKDSIFLKMLDRCRSVITIEPILFMFSLAQGLYIIISQSLYVAKVCKVNLNYTSEICDNIYQHREEQIEVQKYVSSLQAYNGILQAIPAVVFALFAGPWSDSYGRKPLIMFSCLGYIFNNGVFIINTVWFYELKAEYLLFECLQDCTGGYVCFFLGCYAYISDISTSKTRTRRLAFLDGLFPIGFFTGMSISGYLKDAYGFTATFGLSIVFTIATILYTWWFVRDSRTMRPREVVEELEQRRAMNSTVNSPPKSTLNKIFDVENLKQGFHTMFKKREHGVRPYLILLAGIFVMEIFMINGKGPTMYLFLRKELGYDEKAFGMFIAVFGFVGLFTQYVAVPFLTEDCNLHDTTLGLLAVIGCAIQQVMVAFTTRETDWMLYVAGLIAFLGPAITTTARSLVTKCVGPFEVGAVFSVMAAFQAAVPLAASPFYGFIYRATISTFPAAFLLVTAGLYIIVGIMFVVANKGLKKVQQNMLSAEKRVLIDEKIPMAEEGKTLQYET